LKVFVVVFLSHIILSFVESKLSKVLSKNHKTSPLIGSAMGLIPQCGISVVAADLYIKEHISFGTILAIFIACSDEAVPILLSNPDKALTTIPLLILKFILGFLVGFIADLLYRKSREHVDEHIKDCHHEEEVHTGCCGHEIDNQQESSFHKHFVHPLIHSLKIFIYVFIIYTLFGTLIYFIGEENIKNFFESNKYFTPIYAAFLGLIPNCASSVILTEMYMLKTISFGTTLAGLITNAGLGLVVLFKNKKMIKKTFIIVAILLVTSLASGYIINLIFGF